MPKKSNIGIVMLAAGSSERMKQNKLSQKLEGKTLLEKVIGSAQDSIADYLLLVLGAYALENSKLVDKHKIETIINTNWKKGIGTSIKCGIQKALIEQPELNAIIISVCDQPFLTTEIFNGLIQTYKTTGKKIVASEYTSSYGVPVLYDQSMFQNLLNTPDEHGAKKFIIEQADDDIITTFRFPKGEIDIDTIEDLNKITEHKG